MAITTQNAQIQLRRDTASIWTSEDPILASGEMGLEIDTKSLKIGDGSTTWTSLEYLILGEDKKKFVLPWTLCTAWTAGNSITITHDLNSPFNDLMGQIFVRDTAVPDMHYNATNMDIVSGTGYGQRLNGDSTLDSCVLQIEQSAGQYVNSTGSLSTVPTTWEYSVRLIKF